VSFIQGHSAVDAAALARTLAQCPVGGLSSSSWGLRDPMQPPDPMQHPYGNPELFACLERQVANACGTDRIPFHFLA
jgi:hypothetical protein